MLLKLEGFKYAKSSNLNMGYYHTPLTEKTKFYMIILPWGK